MIELISPGVATELTPGQSTRPNYMPLDAFIAESMELLTAQPEATEICVERVKVLRFAAEEGKFDTVFSMLNPLSV